MRRRSMPDMKEGGVNVTPLIDIVMCLIIFFMLVAKIGVSRGDESDIVTPATLLGTEIRDFGPTLTLNVRGGPGLDEPIVTALVKGEKRELKVTSANGDRPLKRVLEALKKENANFEIIVLGESDLPYFQLEQVLISAAQAQVTKVNFQTKKASVLEAGGTVG